MVFNVGLRFDNSPGPIHRPALERYEERLLGTKAEGNPYRGAGGDLNT